MLQGEITFVGDEKVEGKNGSQSRSREVNDSYQKERRRRTLMADKRKCGNKGETY